MGGWRGRRENELVFHKVEPPDWLPNTEWSPPIKIYFQEILNIFSKLYLYVYLVIAVFKDNG